jgi:hypothetical protein
VVEQSTHNAMFEGLNPASLSTRIK